MEKFTLKQLVLVTGATGYVGGRLVPRLIEEGISVRVLARDPRRLQGRPWISRVQVFQGDVLDAGSLQPAMQDVDTAYYLVHSMSGNQHFYRDDLAAARNFAFAAAQAGVKRIIYLGGLGNPQDQLSEHLRSRHLTGVALRSENVPVTEFRAGVIVGLGSLSFEMIQYLTERLPVMICPRWVYTRTQPISINDVLDYLVSALSTPESIGKVIEIGGADVLSYGEMMSGYAQVRGLRRSLIPVPVLTPRLSSYWIHWMTPIPASIARPLIEGLRNEIVVRSDAAQRIFPQIQPKGYLQAVQDALDPLQSGRMKTYWSDALSTSLGDIPPVYLALDKGMIIERRALEVPAPPARVFQVFSGLGGKRGWLAYNFAWWLRGVVDRMIGGVGFRRGRRHPDEIRVGDALDFWRVEAVEDQHLLRLRAEMKVPGKAWLQFEAHPSGAGQTMLVQTAFFAPKGLLGLAYWYGLYPIHSLVFSSLVKKIAERASV